jgi:hypothetical protein
VIEGVVRLSGLISAVVAVPLLLLLAFRGWTRSLRFQLPRWRNGIGLTSLLIVAVVWLWYSLVLVPAILDHHLLEQHVSLRNITAYYEFLLPYYMYPAVLFAAALKGVPRFQALGASLLMMCGFASMVNY